MEVSGWNCSSGARSSRSCSDWAPAFTVDGKGGAARPYSSPEYWRGDPPPLRQIAVRQVAEEFVTGEVSAEVRNARDVKERAFGTSSSSHGAPGVSLTSVSFFICHATRVRSRCVTLLRDLQRINAKLSADMRKRIVPTGRCPAEFSVEFRIKNGNRTIGRDAVAVRVLGVMRQRVQCERVFVQVPRFADERRHKIPFVPGASDR